MDKGKICNYCMEFKLYDSFRKVKECTDGYRGKCKDCERPKRYLHYIKNIEKYKQAYREFILRNPNYKEDYKKRIKEVKEDKIKKTVKI